MAIGIYTSIITLNVNGLNTPTKRHRLAEQIPKLDPYICCLQKPTSDLKTHIDWKWGDGKIYSMQMGSKIKAGVAILISDKIDLKEYYRR